MTVAAVILAASPESALADADGTPAVRRIADAAWAGGATPVVVCSFDPDGAVAAVLANAQVTLVEPAPVEGGPVGQIASGIEAAVRLVAATEAALVWPARMAWVDAETVTTLIAAHGGRRTDVVRPAYAGRAGFPALLPVSHLGVLRSVGVDRMPGEILEDLAARGIPVHGLDSGDPGVTIDVSTSRSELPAYDGPPEPGDAVDRDWGAAIADLHDDLPVPGPTGLTR